MTFLRLVLTSELKGHTQPEQQRNNKSLSTIKTQLQIRLSSKSKQTKQHVIKSDKPSSSWTYTLVRFVNWNRIGGKGPVKGFVDIVLHETNQLIHANKWAVADASPVVLSYGIFLSLSCILMSTSGGGSHILFAKNVHEHIGLGLWIHGFWENPFACETGTEVCWDPNSY